MTWAEFQIRLFAFNRMEKNAWLKIYEVTKNIVEVAPYVKSSDKKKIIKSNRNNYLGEQTKQPINQFQIDAIKKAQLEYNNRNNV